MVFNAIFNYISYIMAILFYWWSILRKPRPAASLTNFIHNVSSNKGVLIAGIYIHTTVYTNLKNTPPSKPEYRIRNKTWFLHWGVQLHPPKRESSSFLTQIRYTTDEGSNGHVRYCYNLASIVLSKLSQLNLFETTGINGTKLFWSTNHRIKKYINGLRIDNAISELRISWYHT